MATFPKGHNASKILGRQIQIGRTSTTITVTKITWHIDPSDAITLRGIPAIGPNVAGAIPGTRPDTSDATR